MDVSENDIQLIIKESTKKKNKKVRKATKKTFKNKS